MAALGLNLGTRASLKLGLLSGWGSRAQQLQHRGLVAPQHVGPALAGGFLNHYATMLVGSKVMGECWTEKGEQMLPALLLLTPWNSSPALSKYWLRVLYKLPFRDIQS